jgi:UDP-GlcNAc:undecaprenyl-phosphate GlcNAc-1-phosphate transferase
VFQRALGALPLLLALIIPAAVLALPFVDLLLAVVRRVRQRRSPFAPDKQHLHHRLLELGHSHRRAVVLLYFWSALLAGTGVALSYNGRQWVVVATVCTLTVVGVLVSMLPGRRSRTEANRVARV